MLVFAFQHLLFALGAFDLSSSDASEGLTMGEYLGVSLARARTAGYHRPGLTHRHTTVRQA